MDPDTQVQHEFFPFLRIYKSSRIERFLGTQVVAAGVDPSTGVVSKDVVIDPAAGVVARLYLPNLSSALPDEKEKKKHPVLVYYHGGGFVIETAFSPTYHNYLNSLVANAKVIAVSVNYRNAPEHALPAAYDDSWQALNWVATGGAGEEWLAAHGDLGRLFLAGDSAGANIVHNMALRASTTELPNGVKIKGVALIHPYFWGVETIGEEIDLPPVHREFPGMLWKFTCPDSPGLDDPRINPLAEGAPSLRGLQSRRVVVTVAQRDFLKTRGRAYYEALKGSGWEGVAELVESVGEEHVFHLKNPDCENAASMMRYLVTLFNTE